MIYLRTCYENLKLATYIFIPFYLLQNQEIPDAISFFKNGLEIFNKVALSPHKDTHIAQEALRACLADNGNTFNVVV